MPNTTPVYAFRSPTLAETPNGPTQIQNLALDVEAQVVALDTRVDAVEAKGVPTAVQVQHSDIGTVTSASYTADRTGTTNEAGVAFVAGPSGKARVHWNVGIFNTIGTNYNLCSFEVRAGATIGSGTVFLAADNARALQYYGTLELHAGTSYLVTGLTPGASYNAQLMYLTQANTASFDRPGIGVDPVWS